MTASHNISTILILFEILATIGDNSGMLLEYSVSILPNLKFENVMVFSVVEYSVYRLQLSSYAPEASGTILNNARTFIPDQPFPSRSVNIPLTTLVVIS